MESNRIICEFMGLRPKMYSPDSYGYRDGVFFSTHDSNPEKVMDSIVGYAKYHTSWDWLMTVVDKIERIVFDEENSFNVTIGSSIYCVIQDSHGEYYDMFYDGEETKIEVVYKAVVEFIVWHNDNKETFK